MIVLAVIYLYMFIKTRYYELFLKEMSILMKYGFLTEIDLVMRDFIQNID